MNLHAAVLFALLFFATCRVAWGSEPGDGTIDVVYPYNVDLVSRKVPAVAYDSARKRVVCFGGLTSTKTVAATMEWDGFDWIQVPTVATPKLSGAMVYDAARGVCVLFDGQATWTWDGAQWTKKSPSSSPTARSSMAMAYDAARQRTVLFGGVSTANVDLGDTWEWDGTTWTSLTPAAAPSARFQHTMAYDAARQVTVLVDGLFRTTTPFGSSTSASSETWEWNGITWTQRTSTPTTMLGPMVYDSLRSRCVAFAATAASLWEWDGSTWTKRSPSSGPTFPGSGVSGGASGSAAFDTERGEMVLVGSTRGIFQTWSWKGSTNIWLNKRTEPRAILAWADVDGDGRQDAVVSGGLAGGTPGLALHLNDGGNFASRPTWTVVTPGTRSYEAGVVGDVDRDGRPDLVVSHSVTNNTLALYLNRGGGQFSTTADWTSVTSLSVPAMVMADVDGDLYPDLLVQRADGVSVFINNQAGAFATTPSTVVSLPLNAAGQTAALHGIAAADLDADGKADLAITAAYSNQPTAWTNVYRGTGTDFTLIATVVGTAGSPAFADIDGDGLRDLATPHALYRNNAGSFGPNPVWTSTGTGVDGLALGDVDGDSDPDVLAIRAGNVLEAALYRNDGGALTSSPVWSAVLRGPSVGYLPGPYS